jgi:hypothetical protein
VLIFSAAEDLPMRLQKEIIGSFAQIRSKQEAEKAAVSLRTSIDLDSGTPHIRASAHNTYIKIGIENQEVCPFDYTSYRNLQKRYSHEHAYHQTLAR